MPSFFISLLKWSFRNCFGSLAFLLSLITLSALFGLLPGLPERARISCFKDVSPPSCFDRSLFNLMLLTSYADIKLMDLCCRLPVLSTKVITFCFGYWF